MNARPDPPSVVRADRIWRILVQRKDRYCTPRYLARRTAFTRRQVEEAIAYLRRAVCGSDLMAIIGRRGGDGGWKLTLDPIDVRAYGRQEISLHLTQISNLVEYSLVPVCRRHADDFELRRVVKHIGFVTESLADIGRGFGLEGDDER